MKPDDHPLMRAVASAIAETDCRGPLVVGVSGGADSVALFRALLHRRGRDRLWFVAAHLDHALRPDSADGARWVVRLGESFDVPVVTVRRDVARLAREQKLGIEEAARRCRYDFLAKTAAEQGGTALAVAHTADDQAETILHHLLRGTGLGGLSGMPAVRDQNGIRLIRPLLTVSRAQVIDFLTGLEQPFLDDETNRDERYTRNRIRHQLLPLLEDQFNPQITRVLSRLGEQARAAQELIDDFAETLLSQALLHRNSREVQLATEPLRLAPSHLVRETLRRLLREQNWPRQRVGFEDWQRLAQLAQSAQAPKSLSLPDGLKAHFRRGVLTIEWS